MGNKYLQILCISTYFLLRCFSHQFSNHDLSMSMTIQPIYFTAHESVNNCSSGQVLPTVKISLCQHLSELSQKGFVMLQLSTSGWDCIKCTTISKPGPSCLFLSKLIVGTPHEAIGACLVARLHCNKSRNHRHLGNFFM